MDKPDRVEVGQWWRGPEIGIMRLEHNAGAGYDWLLGSCSGAEYLGSGPNPEPSEWMIETLAEHLMTCGGSSKSAEPMLFDDVRLHVMAVLNGITSPFVGMESERDATRNVLSLYRILRSLGKW
jgi:hypothetical protein